MRKPTVFSIALLVATLETLAVAAPPPPPIYPPGLPTKLEGYEMDRIYPVYFAWLNRRRETAISGAVQTPQEWRGLLHWNRVVESRVESYDYGIVRADRLDRYCTGDSWKGEPAGRCAYRYVYALVPGSPWDDDAVVAAISKSFLPAKLARRLKAIKWKQSANDWRDEALYAVFEEHTDPKQVFGPLVRSVEVAGSACPDLLKAINGLTKMIVNLSPPAVTRPFDMMPPHGSETRIQITAADADGRAVTLQGSWPLYDVMRPIWNAVEDCPVGK